MPKSPISYVMSFKDSDLVVILKEKTQGFLLTEEEQAKLTSLGKQEYEKYVQWVHAPKK